MQSTVPVSPCAGSLSGNAATLADSGAQNLSIRGGHLRLLPEGAALEPVHNVMLVADVHLGKGHAFRRLGVAVPGGTDATSLARLSGLLARWRPARLIFLGDLIHDRLPHDHALFSQLSQWRRSHPDTGFTLVTGNHDRKGGPLPAVCDIETVEPGARLGELQLLHDPEAFAADNGHGVAGHIHPVVRIRGRADAARVRCFWARPDLTVLPAFGEFTGGYPVRPGRADAFYVLDGQAVCKMPARRQQSQ